MSQMAIVFEAGLRSQPKGFSKLVKGTLSPHGATLLAHAVASIEKELEIQPKIIVWNKVVPQPRDVGFFADPNVTFGYFYSSSCAKSKLPPPPLQDFLSYINTTLNANYNGVLVNRYVDGNNYISDHYDSENGLDQMAGVAIVSYGKTRTMRFKPRTNAPHGCRMHTVPLEHNTLVAMQGAAFQNTWTHGIPKEKKVTGERISLTFRVHDGKNEEALIEKYRRNMKRMDVLAAQGEDEAPVAKRARVVE